MFHVNGSEHSSWVHTILFRFDGMLRQNHIESYDMSEFHLISYDEKSSKRLIWFYFTDSHVWHWNGNTIRNDPGKCELNCQKRWSESVVLVIMFVVLRNAIKTNQTGPNRISIENVCERANENERVCMSICVCVAAF